MTSRRSFPGMLALALLLTGASVFLWPRGGVFRSIGTFGLIVFGVWAVFLWARWRLSVLRRDQEDLRTSRAPTPRKVVEPVLAAEGGDTLVIERQEAPQALPTSEAVPMSADIEAASSRPLELWTQPEQASPPGAELEVWTFGTDPLTAETGWELVEWCLSHGGHEFSVRPVERTRSPRVQTFYDRLRPHALPPARRPILSNHPTDAPIELWRLNRETLQILREFFTYGILANKSEGDFRMEDFAVYREGHMLMAVVTREWEAYVNVLPAEIAELEPMLQRPTRTPWIHA